jgi:hypothetical protein
VKSRTPLQKICFIKERDAKIMQDDLFSKQFNLILHGKNITFEKIFATEIKKRKKIFYDNL